MKKIITCNAKNYMVMKKITYMVGNSLSIFVFVDDLNLFTNFGGKILLGQMLKRKRLTNIKKKKIWNVFLTPPAIPGVPLVRFLVCPLTP